MASRTSSRSWSAAASPPMAAAPGSRTVRSATGSPVSTPQQVGSSRSPPSRSVTRSTVSWREQPTWPSRTTSGPSPRPCAEGSCGTTGAAGTGSGTLSSARPRSTRCCHDSGPGCTARGVRHGTGSCASETRTAALAHHWLGAETTGPCSPAWPRPTGPVTSRRSRRGSGSWRRPPADGPRPRSSTGRAAWTWRTSTSRRPVRPGCSATPGPPGPTSTPHSSSSTPATRPGVHGSASGAVLDSVHDVPHSGDDYLSLLDRIPRQPPDRRAQGGVRPCRPTPVARGPVRRGGLLRDRGGRPGNASRRPRPTWLVSGRRWRSSWPWPVTMRARPSSSTSCVHGSPTAPTWDRERHPRRRLDGRLAAGDIEGALRDARSVARLRGGSGLANTEEWRPRREGRDPWRRPRRRAAAASSGAPPDTRASGGRAAGPPAPGADRTPTAAYGDRTPALAPSRSQSRPTSRDERRLHAPDGARPCPPAREERWSGEAGDRSRARSSRPESRRAPRRRRRSLRLAGRRRSPTAAGTTDAASVPARRGGGQRPRGRERAGTMATSALWPRALGRGAGERVTQGGRGRSESGGRSRGRGRARLEEEKGSPHASEERG